MNDMTFTSKTAHHFTSLVYAGAIWYLSLADYTRSACGQPLVDAVYRQPLGRKIARVDAEPEHVATIVAHVRESTEQG